MTTRRFEGRHALVTGGTDGMGLVVAEHLAREGASLVVCGRDRGKGAAAERQLAAHGGRVRFWPCDIARPEEVASMVEGAADWLGGLDTVFNNAGVTSKRALVGESSLDDWQHVVGINLNGMYYCLRSQLKYMAAAGGGAIVNNSSLAGITAIAGQCAYVASKFGVVGLSQAAALEYAVATGERAAVRVNVIAPGPIAGGMNSSENLAAHPEHTRRKIAATAMQRLGQPEEVASAVLWLLSDGGSYMTGAVIPVDGGARAGKF
ncbi:SDR family NAD(P)-dependent oxidoreductase [Aquincola sp. MAHUQ-54]|uniref:SDR family NAD(P)-dependent oxidoreductase n=1 Tax=Aquincola agrisoli TaxID=3119538 RepID=A0AAW9QB91_9BURK